MEAATLHFDQDTFDHTVGVLKRKVGLSQEDAEEAAQQAFLDAWEGREGLGTFGRGLIVNRAKQRGINMTLRAHRRDVSLDAAREDDDVGVPVELAIDEVDFDTHAEVAKLGRHPVLMRRLEAVRSGASSHLQPRGSHSSHSRYSDATVEKARRLRGEGHTLGEIADVTGATEETIRVWCAREGRLCSTEGWTRELAILAMKVFGEEEGRRPTWADFRGDQRLPSSCPLERIFGKTNTLRKALEAAGYSIRAGAGVGFNDDEIRAMIDSFVEREGRLPKWGDWKTANRLPSPAVLYRRFESASIDVILDQLKGGS